MLYKIERATSIGHASNVTLPQLISGNARFCTPSAFQLGER